MNAKYKSSGKAITNEILWSVNPDFAYSVLWPEYITSKSKIADSILTPPFSLEFSRKEITNDPNKNGNLSNFLNSKW